MRSRANSLPSARFFSWYLGAPPFSMRATRASSSAALWDMATAYPIRASGGQLPLEPLPFGGEIHDRLAAPGFRCQPFCIPRSRLRHRFLRSHELRVGLSECVGSCAPASFRR